MPVLLLARGDQPSRTLLRRAIEARYGLGPPALETARVDVKGRIRTKIGPVATWVALEGTTYFKFPFLLRWNFSTRPAGVPLASVTEAFDGEVYRKRTGRDHVTVVDAQDTVMSMRARMWTICAALLTPLTEHFVELRATGDRSFEAAHTDANVTARLHMHEDDTLEFTSCDCLNPDTGKQQGFMIQFSEGQNMVGNLMMPRKISTFWGDQPELEVTPIKAEGNVPLDDSLFRLGSD